MLIELPASESDLAAHPRQHLGLRSLGTAEIRAGRVSTGKTSSAIAPSAIPSMDRVPRLDLRIQRRAPRQDPHAAQLHVPAPTSSTPHHHGTGAEVSWRRCSPPGGEPHFVAVKRIASVTTRLVGVALFDATATPTQSAHFTVPAELAALAARRPNTMVARLGRIAVDATSGT
jgi:hypothetical protein